MNVSKCLLALSTLNLTAATLPASADTTQWSVEKANQWQQERPWLVGCNYIPSYAVNGIEFFRGETFDASTIDREMGLAEGLGFNCVRVFLHNFPWVEDHEGFLNRIDQFLGLADRHHIQVMFALLDSCWDPLPKPGRQPEPRPGVHASQWVQTPGVEILTNAARHIEVKGYIQAVVGRFRSDHRVLAWDVFNEPDATDPEYALIEPTNKAEFALMLLKEAIPWTREMNPSQPLTVGVTETDPDSLSASAKFSLEQSDIISFHDYSRPAGMRHKVECLKRYHRPILCSEWMARPIGSVLDPILGYLKAQDVASFSNGLVTGRAHAMYPWSSRHKPCTAEPKVWFHDLFRKDGTPFDAREIIYIRSLTDAPNPGAAR
jgi:hypothetical protein